LGPVWTVQPVRCFTTPEEGKGQRRRGEGREEKGGEEGFGDVGEKAFCLKSAPLRLGQDECRIVVLKTRWQRNIYIIFSGEGKLLPRPLPFNLAVYSYKTTN